MNINKLLREERHKGCSRYGAQMGRRNIIGEPQKLHLQRIDYVDGDYDAGGAYWGSGGGPLYCAFSKDETTIIFVRASSRKNALLKVQELTGLFGKGFTFFLPNA